MVYKKSQVPLYRQVENELLALIENKTYPVGSLIPSEKELEQYFQVSRITIRRAITELEKQGFLVKRQGKGTFVQSYKIQRNIIKLGSYTQYMNEQGREPVRKIIQAYEISASRGLATLLAIEESTPVICLQRIFEFGFKNKGLEISYYAAEQYPELLERIYQHSSMTELLKQKYGKTEAASDQRLELALASKEQASLLEVDLSAPLFKLQRRVWDRDHSLLYYAVMYYDATKFSFDINN